MSIALEIAKQLGGFNRLNVMIGAKDFINLIEGLSFKFNAKSTKIKCNYIKITLNHKDLYNIEYGYVRKCKYKQSHFTTDVYSDKLLGNIENVTGLALQL